MHFLLGFMSAYVLDAAEQAAYFPELSSAPASLARASLTKANSAKC
jgi:hypothetical protein